MALPESPRNLIKYSFFKIEYPFFQTIWFTESVYFFNFKDAAYQSRMIMIEDWFIKKFVLIEMKLYWSQFLAF